MKSIINGNWKGTCYLCKRITGTEEHHIFGGPNRKLSERYGLKVYLCTHCHRDNKSGAHGSREVAEHLKQIGQAAFEENHTREEFIKIFGKNHLENLEPENQQASINIGAPGILERRRQQESYGSGRMELWKKEAKET